MSDQLFRRKAPVVMRGLLREFPVLDVLDAAGILGNIGGESGGFTLMQEVKPTVAGSRGGYGWCQWTGPRRRQFEAWCHAQGLDVSSDEANFGYLCHELRTTEKAAIAAVRRAPDLKAKVIAFERTFERAGIPHYDGRFKWAQLALQTYQATEPQQAVAEPVAELEPDPQPAPLPRARPAEPEPNPEPAPIEAKVPLYKRLWAKVTGALTIGGGLGLGGMTLDADTIYAICALVGVLAVATTICFLGWIYLVPPRGQIRKGL